MELRLGRRYFDSLFTSEETLFARPFQVNKALNKKTPSCRREKQCKLEFPIFQEICNKEEKHGEKN